MKCLIKSSTDDQLHMSIYTTNELIFQDKPDYGIWNVRGWKTLNGYLNEARELSTCILKNRADYRWFVTLNFDKDYNETDHKKVWKQVAANLRNSSIEAIAVREPSRSNKIHYHIIVCDHKEYQTIEEVYKVFDAAFPAYYQNPRQYRVHVRQIASISNAAWYITKGKRKNQPDTYWKKRLLFSKDFNLDKVVTIGSFWKTKRKDIWAAVVKAGKKYGEEQRAIEAAITDDIRREARQLKELVFEYTIEEIERKLAASELRKLNPSYDVVRSN